MKKLLLLAIFTYSLVLHSFCQMTVSDSLQKEISKTNNAKLLITLYQKLGTFYMSSKLKEATAPIRKALELANKENDKNAMALAYYTLGTISERQGFFDAALLLADSCKRNIENNTKGESIKANYEILLGSVARRKAKYEDAMQHFYTAQKIAEKLDEKLLLYNSHTYLGICNVSIKNYARALEHHQKAVDAAIQMKDYRRIANSNNNIGIIYREKEEYKLADNYFEKALPNALLSKDSSVIAIVYGEAGNVKTELGDYATARKYMINAEGIYLRMQQLNDLPYIYFYLSDLEAKEKNVEAGKMWIQKALQLATKLGSKKQITDSYNSYHYFYMNMKMYDSALVNYKKYKELDAETNNEKVKTKIEELNIQYEIQKKETALKTQRLRTTYLALGLLFMGFVGLALYNQSRKKQLKLEVAIQKAKAEEQTKINKAILSAEEQERKRISRDLHDNMGAYTSALIANVQQLKSKTGDSNEVQNMQSNAEQILASLRETIWVLNNKEVTIQEFSDGFKNYCFKILKNFEDISFNATENIESNVMLKAATAIHLNKILQEAVQNIIKHANATQLNYTINSNKKIQITIQDNGKGFDQHTANKGNGLENMQWRAKEVGIEIAIQSIISEGTTITINTL
jgi:signal transduction histidine kinase